ncbi:hypothetical protein MVEN_01644500 [Mycena venus]|uniref:F-box domain-containing protein n=1 Tax=Mycena venus TaxID=2733690 RepID=A0A8H7CQS4_9AGAR|nr:hypothetical protein MVEN_01644500 [Mycena venus]
MKTLRAQLPDIDISELRSNESELTNFEVEQIRQHIYAGDETISQLADEIGLVSATLAELRERQATRQAEVKALRALISPIRRFPPEILSEIFLSLLRDVVTTSSLYSSVDTSQPPLVLGRVSSMWRATSLTTPRLWTGIQLSPTKPIGRGVMSLLELFNERSRPIPLRLGIDIPAHLYIGTPLTVLWSFSSRLEALQVEMAAAYLQPLVGMPDHMFPSLRSLDICIVPGNSPPLPPFVGTTITAFARAPRLHNLKIVSTSSLPILRLFSLQFPWAQLKSLHLGCSDGPLLVRNIVSQCLELETCTIILYDITMFDLPIPLVNSVLPKLQTLTYTGPEDDYDEDFDQTAEFLDFLSFPQLQSLEINMVPWSAEILPGLYQRSQFELTTLTLGRLNISSDDVVKFFTSIPSLKELNLNYGPGVDDDLFEALIYSVADSRSAILPELEVLTIKVDPAGNDDVNGSTILELLESRWWPDPAPGASDPPSAISRLKQATVQFDRETFLDFHEGEAARLDLMVAAGVLHYGWAA